MKSIPNIRRMSFYRLFAHFARKHEFRWIPDKWYLKWCYRGNTGRKLNLSDPKRFGEILQWQKINDRKPIYSTMVDKFAAKAWAADIIGSEHIIPTLGVWENFDDIDFDMLPDQFVIKCTHDSHSAIICRNKQSFDRKYAKAIIEKALKRNYFYEGRQWPYKNVQQRIIVEQYFENKKTADLRDYKFFTFRGRPKIMYIATGRGNGETFGDFFDMDFNHLDLTIDHRMASERPEKPELFEEMKRAAEMLAKGTFQVRVDFYESNGQFYFGEMTFFHCSGFLTFQPDSWDELLGSWLR